MQPLTPNAGQNVHPANVSQAGRTPAGPSVYVSRGGSIQNLHIHVYPPAAAQPPKNFRFVAQEVKPEQKEETYVNQDGTPWVCQNKDCSTKKDADGFTITPQPRTGPLGGNTLCNKCGIAWKRYGNPNYNHETYNEKSVKTDETKRHRNYLADQDAKRSRLHINDKMDISKLLG